MLVTSHLSITVTWEPVEGDVVNYLIEYRMKLNQMEWQDVTVDPTVNSFVITGLSPSTTYEVRIFAISSEGIRSEGANPIPVTTQGT